MDKLTPAQQRAMDQLTGTLDGRIAKGQGVRLATARVLHRLGVAHLIENYREDGTWVLVLVEPQVREITDAQLSEALVEKRMVTLGEADLLRPLAPADRYRALRHAHIAREAYGKGPLAVQYGDAGTSRAAVLANRVALVLSWKSGKTSDRQYGEHRDLAGEQFKASRNVPTNLWAVGTGYGEAVLTVEAPSAQEAEGKARAAIEADPVGYRELVNGFGMRRMTVQDAVDARRAREAAERKA